MNKNNLITFSLIILALIASAYIRNFTWQDPVTLWSNAVSQSPNKVRPNYEMGLAYAARGANSIAFTYMKRAKNLDASFFGNAMFLQAKKYQQEGRSDEAIREYKKILRQQPNSPEALNSLGMIYFQKSLFIEAEQAFIEAIRMKPAFSEAHSNLGQVYQQMNHLEGATREYREAIRLNPADAEPHAELGYVYAKAAQYEAAIAEFRIALKLDPQHANARRYLEQALAYTKAR